jgi:UDP-N-acetylglucosamine 2-epimerase (non-hydrolysing)
MKRILIVYGTRPEAIKVAPLIRVLAADAQFEPVVCVTGQHREMLDQVNQLFSVIPDHDLNVILPRQTLTHITATVLERMQPVLEDVQPDAVVVQGDTTTTFAAALAAFYAQIPVVHVEAGLRTGDRYSPFPEEINRRLTTQLASLHLAPTAISRANLLAEGVSDADIAVTGNTVIDALHIVLDDPPPWKDGSLADLDDDDRRVVLVTSHRRESLGEQMREIGEALRRIVDGFDDVLLVFPVHRNPAVREAILPAIEGHLNVLITEPVDYSDFARLMARAYLVLTDSGGVQEEAPSLGKPVLVLRTNTERPEAVEAGTVRLVGTHMDSIVNAATELLSDPLAYARMARATNPYGDGTAAARSLSAIRSLLHGTPMPEPFLPISLGAS